MQNNVNSSNIRQLKFLGMINANYKKNSSFSPNKQMIKLFCKMTEFPRIYHRAEIHNPENIPERGGALIITNHGRLNYEVAIQAKLIFDKTGRFPRGLIDHAGFQLPIVRSVAPLFGAVDGTRKNALKLLKEEELCMCAPGGYREAFASPYGKYKILWEGRYGFIKVALEAKVPIIPIACIGNNEGVINLTKGNIFGKLIFGSDYYRVPLNIGMIPFPMHYPFSHLFPFPIKFDFYVGSPIYLENSPNIINNQKMIENLHKKVSDSFQNMLDEFAAKRKSMFPHYLLDKLGLHL